MYRPNSREDDRLIQLYLSLDRPGTTLTPMELREQLEDIARKIATGEQVAISLGDLELIRSELEKRSKKRRCGTYLARARQQKKSN